MTGTKTKVSIGKGHLLDIARRQSSQGCSRLTIRSEKSQNWLQYPWPEQPHGQNCHFPRRGRWWWESGEVGAKRFGCLMLFMSKGIGKFCGQRSLVGYSPRGPIESDMTEQACKPQWFLVMLIRKAQSIGSWDWNHLLNPIYPRTCWLSLLPPLFSISTLFPSLSFSSLSSSTFSSHLGCVLLSPTHLFFLLLMPMLT